VIQPAAACSASSAWTAAAARDHRKSVDVDALAMAARQRFAGAVTDGVATAVAGTAAGGLSLSSTASNDTGYSSIGNSGERPGGRVVRSDTGDMDVMSRSTSCEEETSEQRPSVAELRQRFQTHSVSQPAELSKRCVAALSATASTSASAGICL